MPVEHIHTYLVYPRSVDEESKIGGAAVTLEGKLYQLLNEVYNKSDNECDIDISFNPAQDGAQANPCRSLITAYLTDPSLEHGRAIAQRLESVTTNRSGLGLLFIIAGKEGQEHKIVLSRFPADSAILAEEDKEELSVAFLERVFMKSAFSYKAVAYRGTSLNAHFWQGRAIDKQIGNPIVRVSEYWIKGFLDSDFRTTSANGTRRLAVALRSAAQASRELSVKQEITAAATLAAGLQGQPTSIDDFQQRYGLSEAAQEQINKQVANPAVRGERFVFSNEEFTRHVKYRSVELDSGAVLTADSTEFDEIFSQEPVGGDGGAVRFSTEGTVVGERLRSANSSVRSADVAEG